MSVIASSTVRRPSRSRRARAVALWSVSPRIAEATPRPTSQRPSRTLAGFATRLSQPKRAAPSRSASARWREENGRFRSGSISCRCEAATRSDRARAPPPTRPSRIRAPAAQSPRPARASNRNAADPACAAMPGQPVRRGVEHAGRAADRLGVDIEARAMRDRILAEGDQPAVVVRA